MTTIFSRIMRPVNSAARESCGATRLNPRPGACQKTGLSNCAPHNLVFPPQRVRYTAHMRLGGVPVLILVSTLALAGCAHRTAPLPAAAAPTLQGDPAHPGHTTGWVDTKLYFGLGPADQPEKGIGEAQWREFLDKEVTPRFPAGLSVVDVYGQWQGKHQSAPERLRSKMLIIDYPDNAGNRAKIAAIRSAWKQRTGDQSVLEVTEPADVSF